jgi:hypothetical protein
LQDPLVPPFHKMLASVLLLATPFHKFLGMLIHVIGLHRCWMGVPRLVPLLRRCSSCCWCHQTLCGVVFSSFHHSPIRLPPFVWRRVAVDGAQMCYRCYHQLQGGSSCPMSSGLCTFCLLSPHFVGLTIGWRVTMERRSYEGWYGCGVILALSANMLFYGGSSL